MSVNVTFYFDPVSPYAWLASTQLERLEAAGAVIDVQPVLFAGLLGAHGTKGPAEVPAKRAYTMRDVMRCAQALGLQFKGPPSHPFNPLRALRCCSALDDAAARRRLGPALLSAAWEEGLDLSDAEVVAAVADRCGLDGSFLVTQGSAPQVKQRLADATHAAAAAGIFGVPSFVIDGEIFWGADRIDAILRSLQGQRIDEGRLDQFLARAPSASR
jgi:2-hydroxychromene-2-carboxylate isomerase